MADKNMKRCSKSLVINEIQIKISMKYHYIPARIAKIKNINTTKCWQSCEETGLGI